MGGMVSEPGGGAPPTLRLAIDSYRTPPAADELDLRWSLDEVDFVRPALHLAWQSVSASALERSRRYEVADPYGASAAYEVVSQHFVRSITPDMLTFGAGVTGLLHVLATLTAGARVAVSRFGHPDLPSLARQRGAEVVSLDDRLTADVTFLESPDLFGRPADADEVRGYAAASRLCIVDESQANYFGPDASLVRLVDEIPNLMVLRGLAKGYCCGGLRIGYAVAAAGPTSRLRGVATPLATSTLALDMALALLRQGDVFGGLRQRIRTAKPTLVAALTRLGLPVRAGHPELPWVTVPWSTSAVDVLRCHRLRGKELTLSGHSVIKLVVPLSDERRRLFARATAE